MKTVSVKFSSDYGNKTYAYMTDIEDVEVGDVLVVESPHSGFTCVKVTAVDESATAVSKATKWVVCKVDTEAYKARVEREKQRGILVAKLQKLQKEILERDQFAQLAALSPEAAELVEQLKSL